MFSLASANPAYFIFFIAINSLSAARNNIEYNRTEKAKSPRPPAPIGFS